MRAAALVTLAVIAAATAVAGASARQPAFYRVTVRATLQERATYTLTGDAACFWSARGIAVRHLEIATAAPVTLTAAQLANGVGLPLVVHEIRLANHNGVIGACARLGPEISDPGDRCGKRAYRIPASAVKIRLHDGKLAFSLVRIAADPYGNRCAPSVWGAVPRDGFTALVATLHFPPKPVAAPVVVRKHGATTEADSAWTGTVSTSDATLGRTDMTTDAWQIALTFG